MPPIRNPRGPRPLTPTSSDGPRAWTVTLEGERTVEVTGRRLIITAAGDLMVLNSSDDPRHIFAAGVWRECEHLRTKPSRQDPLADLGDRIDSRLGSKQGESTR